MESKTREEIMISCLNLQYCFVHFHSLLKFLLTKVELENIFFFNNSPEKYIDQYQAKLINLLTRTYLENPPV